MREYKRWTRRHFLSSTACALTTGCLAANRSTGSPSDIVRGRVTHLTHGVIAGVPGVLVSNGLEVTRTDHNGAYALPVRDGVFVIKPAHWATPRDAKTGLPIFWRNHNPLGSPTGMRYGGAPATGPLPLSVDFVLEREPEPKAFTALLYADPQPADQREIAFLQYVMDKIAGQRGVAFALALGDIAGDNLDVYPSYLQQTARIDAPVWHLPGNHDHDCDAPTPQHRLDTWRATFGPPTYAFEYSDTLFVMLDNVHPLPGGSYEGRIGHAGLTFIRNLLSFTPEDKLIVICAHIPLASSHSADPSCVTSDAPALLRILRGRKAVSFSGHMHTSEHHYFGCAEHPHHHQIIAALSGSWWSGPLDASGNPYAIGSDGTPQGWHMLSIDGNEYQTDFVSARDETIGRLIFSRTLPFAKPAPPLEVVVGVPSPFGLMVNVFDGGPRTRVFIEQDANLFPLDRVNEEDPHTKRLYAMAGSTLKHWVRAEPSTHLWALSESAYSRIDPARAQLTVIDEFNHCRIAAAPLFTT
jgi:hypothetical protein